MTDNPNIALLSMLLLNFADSHIQWSIQVIAMTFGIAIYAIIIYLILKTKEKHQLRYTALLIPFLFVIVWTHTVSGFIALVSVISLYVGSFIYRGIYEEDKHKELVVSLTLCLIFVVLLVFHWMDLNYPFYESITIGLVNSLNKEIIGMLLAFVSRVIIVRYTTQTEYGIFSLALVLMSIFVMISTLGLQSGVTRQIAYFRGKKDSKKVSGIVKSSIQIALVASIFSSILLFFPEFLAL